MLDRTAAQPSSTEGRLKPVVANIKIFPIKSLDPMLVSSARVLPSGALEHDRAWALFDAAGNFVNGKRHATVHRLRSSIDLVSQRLALRDGTDNSGQETAFHLDHDRGKLESWLSRYFGFAVSLRRNGELGFPDDLESPGPTLISTATLAEIGRWFGLSIDDMRRRFRSNIEIGGVPAFWEDRLFGQPGAKVRFRIGNVVFDGINPCQRCAVPPRDALTGKNDDTFVRRFAELRQRTLPDWSTRERFNHFYRVAINTRLSSTAYGDAVEAGDEIEILEPPATRKYSVAIPARDYWSGDLVVDGIRSETPTVKTFRLRKPEGKLPFDFFAGQFLTVSVAHGTGLLQRCYTISSSPSEREYCEITVKREGRVSSFLHDECTVGSPLSVSGPMGSFTLKTAEDRPLLFIAGGVGLTPLMSKLRFLRHTKSDVPIHLIYSVKSADEIIFREELDRASIPSNIRVHVTVTGGDPAWSGARGRLTPQKIVSLIPDVAQRAIHLCGPLAMASATQKMLHELGVPYSNIEIEAFGGRSLAPSNTGEQEVRFTKSGRAAPVHGTQTILDAALGAEIALDHGCRAGVCGRCKARLLEGEVTIACDFVLTPEQKAQGYFLTCQAHPVGPIAVDC